jgi:nucleoside-specific outer membrane channel protein Tsx
MTKNKFIFDWKLTDLKLFYQSLGVVFLALMSSQAQALDWSDNYVSWRYGDAFREPFNPKDISKNIFSFTHASGYSFGTNFLNVDYLLSDSNDPIRANSSSGAKELYVVYRHTLDLGKVLDKDLRYGIVRGLGLTAGFDYNIKEDADYNSRKRMLVLGPTVMLDVPGFLNVSLLSLWESNRPSISSGAFNPEYPEHRYYYDTHPMLDLVWGIPVGSLPLSFEGYADFIAAKGFDETGHSTAPETNIDMQMMYDMGRMFNLSKHKFRLGLEYQYWKNKFGNSDAAVGPLGGNFAHTPMIRAEYHF